MAKSVRAVADIPVNYPGTFVAKGIRRVSIVTGNPTGSLMTEGIRRPAGAITNRRIMKQACFG